MGLNLDLRRLIGIARRWWWLLLLAPLVAGAAARYASSQQQPLYAATAILKINPPQTGGTNYLEVEGTKSVAETYRQLITTRPVLESVVMQLDLPYGPEKLEDKVSATTVPGTVLVKVRVSDPDPEAAATIANTVANIFLQYTVDEAARQRGPVRQTLDQRIADTNTQIQETNDQISQLEARPDASSSDVQAQINNLRNTVNQQQSQLNDLLVNQTQLDQDAATAQTQVSISEPAIAADSPFAPQTTVYTILAVFAGLIIACGVVVLLEYLDNTVKAEADFPALTGGPLLAAVSTVPKLRAGNDQLFLVSHPRESATEAIRVLRANIEFAAAAKEITTLAVTSAGPGEGKSTITANLGVAMSQAGFSTIIIDADLRRPTQHRIFDVGNERGLTTILTHPQQSWRSSATTLSSDLSLIPSGPLPPNPSDLLSLDRLSHLLADLARDVDVILLDTPPVLAVSDPLVVATKVDGVVLVCRANHTRLDALRRAASSLQQGGIRVVGAVLNQRSGRGSGGYYYYYGDPSQPAPAESQPSPLTAKRSTP